MDVSLQIKPSAGWKIGIKGLLYKNCIMAN